MNNLDGGKVEGRVRKHSYRKYFSEFYIFATLLRTRHIHEETVLAAKMFKYKDAQPSVLEI